MQPPFHLPESRCIGDFGDFKLLLWSIDGFCVAPFFCCCVFPISSSLSNFSAHLLSLEPVLSCFAPIQTERFSPSDDALLSFRTALDSPAPFFLKVSIVMRLFYHIE